MALDNTSLNRRLFKVIDDYCFAYYFIDDILQESLIKFMASNIDFDLNWEQYLIQICIRSSIDFNRKYDRLELFDFDLIFNNYDYDA